MGELDVLKQRMEQADLRLRTAHSTRERESAALKEMWTQIHGRFAEQDSELAALRAQIVELEDAKNELLTMVRTLLTAVEDGVDHMRDEAVPEIAAMAGELLGGDGVPDVPAWQAPDRPLAGHEDDAPAASGPAETECAEPAGESLSPGIRDLITRVEGSFVDGAAADPADDEEDEDELARDLREIEALRNELNGLRARMSANGA